MPRIPRALGLTPLLAGLLALSACSSRAEPPTPPLGASPVSTSAVSSAPPEVASAGPGMSATPGELASAGPAGVASREALRGLYLLPHPTGTGPEIALRFLSALQRRAYLAAARELYIAGRTAFASSDEAALRTVLDDVAANAGLTTQDRCTTARPVDATSAVVFCGGSPVVVHVLADRYGSGVLLSEQHPRFDRYGDPHTHAYTRLRP